MSASPRQRARTLARPLQVALIVCAVITACAGTRGAEPHAASVVQHEREAEVHTRSAEAHEQQACLPAADPRANPICWDYVRNPTAMHLAAAKTHRRQAAEHRAASAALRDAEARACTGVAPDDRDMSPFQHAADIVAVRPLRAVGQIPGRGYGPVRTVGVVVTFRAVPGMSVESLQRVIDCHLARNASLGHVVPELPDCPLVPRGVRARVSSTRHGFAVTIVSADRRVAEEAFSRARRLRPAP